MTGVPRIAISHTVASQADVRVISSTSGYTASIAAGRYWTDRIYTGEAVAVDLAYATGLAVKTAASLATMGVTYSGDTTYLTAQRVVFNPSATFKFDSDSASTNSEGKRILRRLGVDQLRDYPASEADPVTTLFCQGMWEPVSYREAGMMLEAHNGESGGLVVAADGTAYTTHTMLPTRRRSLVFSGLQGYEVVAKSTRFPDATNLTSGYWAVDFETVAWPWLLRGEFLRYYQDSSANYQFLSAACAATDATITFGDDTGVVAGAILCVDGELMEAVANTSGTTWSVIRNAPVAHAISSPVGINAWVATYALATDGGNVNRNGFAPARRAVNQDRWDIDIALVRATP